MNRHTFKGPFSLGDESVEKSWVTGIFTFSVAIKYTFNARSTLREGKCIAGVTTTKTDWGQGWRPPSKLTQESFSTPYNLREYVCVLAVTTALEQINKYTFTVHRVNGP